MTKNIKKKVGQPPKFGSVEEIEKLIEAYFTMCEIKEKPLTMSGLALALNVDRRTIVNYSNKEEYFLTIKKARSMCENYAEECLFSGRQVAGVIFNLKNNYGWYDKREIGHSGAVMQINLTEEQAEAKSEANNRLAGELGVSSN